MNFAHEYILQWSYNIHGTLAFRPPDIDLLNQLCILQIQLCPQQNVSKICIIQNLFLALINFNLKITKTKQCLRYHFYEKIGFVFDFLLYLPTITDSLAL